MKSDISTFKPGGPAIGGAFDSHAHFGEDWPAVLARAREAGMAGLVAVGCDTRTNAFAKAVALAAPDFALLALGFDYSSGISPDEAEAQLRPLVLPPSERGANEEEDATVSVGHLSHPCSPCEISSGAAAAPLRAIGEIGLDYSRPDNAPPAAQRALFERQIALAAEWNLPVIVHSREATADTLAALRAAGSPTLAAEGRLGVLHCFVGDLAFAQEVMAMGMMVSMSGIVTFRNAEALRAVAAAIPDDRLLVETDCPYLAPVPLRGHVNEPAFVSHTIRYLAALRGVAPEALAEQTCHNALRLFKG